MGKYVKVTIQGEMFKGEKLPLAVEAMLNDVGAASVQAMKHITQENDVSKRLSHSITWQTKDKGSNAMGQHKNEDQIDKPSEAGVLYVGSDAPHALYRDTYSGIHMNPEGSEEFIKSLSKWANQVLGISKDDPDPHNRMRFWYLVDHIRNEKTFGVQFLQPTADQIPQFVKSAFRRAYKLAKGKVGK